jgi:hypothetical protein
LLPVSPPSPALREAPALALEELSSLAASKLPQCDQYSRFTKRDTASGA